MSVIEIQKEQELHALIRASARRLLDMWPGGGRSTVTSLMVQTKSDGSLVTLADSVSNQIILEGLQRLFPGDGIISEEAPIEVGVSARNRIWLLDPLDGTQGYVDGSDDFAVLLALLVARQLAYSIVCLPARGEFAYAAAGSGASLNGVRLKVSAVSKIRPQALCLRHLEIPQSPLVFPKWLGSGDACLKLCAGIVDAVIIKIRKHKEWDLAAQALAVVESGGKVTDEHGKQIDFAAGSLLCRYFVASNGVVHSEALSLLQQHPGK